MRLIMLPRAPLIALAFRLLLFLARKGRTHSATQNPALRKTRAQRKTRFAAVTCLSLSLTGARCNRLISGCV